MKTLYIYNFILLLLLNINFQNIKKGNNEMEYFNIFIFNKFSLKYLL